MGKEYLMKKYTMARSSGETLHKTTVVCVTNQFQCERIIRAGRSIANISDTELLVVNVSPLDFARQNGEALEHLFRVSKENNAQMSVLYSDEALKTLTNFIKKSHAVNVVTGMPQQDNSVLVKMWEKLGGVSFFTVDEKGNFVNMNARRKKYSKSSELAQETAVG